jgi:hypothetical protein
MYKRMLAVGTVLALMLVLFTANSSSLAAPQLQARSVITYPTDGATVSGVVDVMGIATHPNIRMYQIRYAAGPEPAADSRWVDFAIVEGTQVENDALGTWDTTIIPDGLYALALAVWGLDDAASPYVFFVTNLTVNNAEPVASPTPETPTPESMPTEEVGPSPTPVPVEQPATSTPRSSPTPDSEVIEPEISAPTEDAGEGFSLPIDFTELRTAFVTGGKITLSLFGLWALYVFVKAVVRWLLRQGVRAPWK